jgi:hypothetical protein
MKICQREVGSQVLGRGGPSVYDFNFVNPVPVVPPNQPRPTLLASTDIGQVTQDVVQAGVTAAAQAAGMSAAKAAAAGAIAGMVAGGVTDFGVRSVRDGVADSNSFTCVDTMGNPTGPTCGREGNDTGPGSTGPGSTDAHDARGGYGDYGDWS